MEQSSEHTNDKAVWQAIKAGDQPGFNRIFKKYYSELYYYGIKIFPDPDFIKESIQEVFVRIWETRQSLADVENVKAYLIVSVRRMIFIRKKNAEFKQIVELGKFENSTFFFDVNEFEKHEDISDEVRRVLLHAINSLTVKQRELIMLFFYHELPYSEIAQIMGISVQAVRNLMCRTLIHLRKSIGEKSLKLINNLFFTLFSSISAKKM
ncbi:RNA polymerase sigma factor [Gaoshiqia sp. Z1-71]|uniref:RNA polymerase sigma factor n=1 Tax=Gaoshiqia hydrogeniformans TaxID=3290090 RepID=UPI003BF867AD